MKKLLCIIVILCSFFSSLLFAGEFSIDCGLINFAVEVDKNNVSETCDLNLFDVSFYNEEKGFGASFSPFYIYTHVNDSEYKSKMEFLNVSFFYDFFHFERDFELKPFVSVGVLNPSDLLDFTAKCGLNFSLFRDKEAFDYFRLRIVSVETGVKYCDKNASFYCNLGLDAGLIIIVIFRGIFESSVKN